MTSKDDLLPERLYCSFVEEGADGKDYVCTDFRVDGDTEYLRADLVSRAPSDVTGLVEALEKIADDGVEKSRDSRTLIAKAALAAYRAGRGK